MPKRKSDQDETWGRKRQFLGRIANRSKVKTVQLLSLGKLVFKQGWSNAGYIFPKDFEALIQYKFIADPSRKVPYRCQIRERGGKPWFVITCDELGESFEGKSPTACWKQILDRINLTLQELNQPLVRTQVAGPEYFGLNDPRIVEMIEELDPKKQCTEYWTEKEKILEARLTYEQTHPKAERKRKKRSRRDSESPQPECDAGEYTGAWSCIERQSRYLRRTQQTSVPDDNPLPEHIDPITLQPVVLPALSPYGHVAGYYTWVQALKETDGLCPFTKLPLTIEMLTKLSIKNIDKYREAIRQI